MSTASIVAAIVIVLIWGFILALFFDASEKGGKPLE
jgi:hypothetical protein